MTRLRMAHASLQYGDSKKQHTHDVEALFKRANDRRYAFLGGTEAGRGSGNTGEELLRVGREAGYRLWVPEIQGRGDAGRTDCWLAVREDLIAGEWVRDYKQVIPGSDELRDEMNLPPGKRWSPKGIVFASWQTEDYGKMSYGVAHYLTDARKPSSPYWEWNKKLGKAVGEWGDEVAKGTALAFYSGDQNMADSKNNEPQGDTFFGAPWTSAGDELKHWENTGHGAIDVIASYNRDGRVSASSFRVFDDKEFFLHTDHFLLEAVYEVQPLPKK